MKLLELFFGFLKVGCFAFGGAYGAIPLIRDVVLSNGWLDDEMLTYMIVLLIAVILRSVLKDPYVQAVLRGLKPCMIGIVLATGAYMILKNGVVLQDGGLLLRPLLLTVLLGAVYFGSRKLRKGGISPILLICLSAAAGIAAYGI